MERQVFDDDRWHSLVEREAILRIFINHYRATTTPFDCRFARLDLHRVPAVAVFVTNEPGGSGLRTGMTHSQMVRMVSHRKPQAIGLR
jgi:hypothetical protein